MAERAKDMGQVLLKASKSRVLTQADVAGVPERDRSRLLTLSRL